MITSFGTEKTV